MGIAILTLSGLFQGFSALQRLTSTAALVQPQRPVRALRTVLPGAVRPQASPRPVSAIRLPRASALRVVRVCDAQPMPGDVGRMRISGRMADVCAELERLAEREATGKRH